MCVKVKDYTDYRSFLKDVIDEKIKENSNLSIRWFATKLDWPASLINDVFARRRDLTTVRLIELGTFLELNSNELEYLIFLGLKECSKPAVKEFFENEVHLRSNLYSQDVDDIPVLLHELSSQAILCAILLIKTDQDPQAIKDLLFTFPELTIEEVENVIHEVFKQGILYHEDGKIQISIDQYRHAYSGFSEKALDYMSQYVENAIRFLASDKKQGPGKMDYKFVAIPLKNVDEVFARFLEMFNWLEKIKVDSIDLPTSEQNLFQVGMTLFPLGDKEVLEKL